MLYSYCIKQEINHNQLAYLYNIDINLHIFIYLFLLNKFFNKKFYFSILKIHILSLPYIVLFFFYNKYNFLRL